MNNIKLIFFNFFFGSFILISSIFFDYRFDTSVNKRFTLNADSINYVNSIKKKISINVFLYGKLPTSYRKLHNETKRILRTFKSLNKNFYINYIDPFETELSIDNLISEMSSYGMKPDFIIDTNNQSLDQKFVFPWIVINDTENSILIPLTESSLGNSSEKKIIKGIEQLEIKIIDGIKRLNIRDKEQICFLTSHETSSTKKISDWIQTLQMYYDVSFFDLKKYKKNPKKTLDNLNKFPLLIISNPKQKFLIPEKFILDQYHANGGNILWLIDALNIDNKLLFDNNGIVTPTKNDLELDDYFFNYGLRLKYDLIKDVYCAPIVIANGNGSQTQYIPFPWTYSPISKPTNSLINQNNIENLWFRFVSSIDTIESATRKQILVKSSNFSQVQSVSKVINLQTEINRINPDNYNDTSKTLAVLTEGNYKSLFKNRISPISDINKIKNGKSKLILIGDGQFGENQIKNSDPLELGYDKWTNNFYSNKKFLINVVHYLAKPSNLSKIRLKKVKINLFDQVKIKNRNKFEWVLFLFTPLIFLFFLRILINKSRKLVS
ncbi:MAG: gliding motility-associated ABC transporter substrate-binding protein GldG [Flavobacteriaceae bacterium]|nr:gliding motility-associated ABC transporter substrate-binding protein GldG [Flavobacteriaceae bacterium]